MKRTEGAKGTFNKGHPRMGTPRDKTIRRQGTGVPLGRVVLSGRPHVPVQCVTSGALLALEG